MTWPPGCAGSCRARREPARFRRGLRARSAALAALTLSFPGTCSSPSIFEGLHARPPFSAAHDLAPRAGRTRRCRSCAVGATHRHCVGFMLRRHFSSVSWLRLLRRSALARTSAAPTASCSRPRLRGSTAPRATGRLQGRAGRRLRRCRRPGRRRPARRSRRWLVAHTTPAPFAGGGVFSVATVSLWRRRSEPATHTWGAGACSPCWARPARERAASLACVALWAAGRSSACGRKRSAAQRAASRTHGKTVSFLLTGLHVACELSACDRRPFMWRWARGQIRRVVASMCLVADIGSSIVGHVRLVSVVWPFGITPLRNAMLASSPLGKGSNFAPRAPSRGRARIVCTSPTCGP